MIGFKYFFESEIESESQSSVDFVEAIKEVSGSIPDRRIFAIFSDWFKMYNQCHSDSYEDALKKFIVFKKSIYMDVKIPWMLATGEKIEADNLVSVFYNKNKDEFSCEIHDDYPAKRIRIPIRIPQDLQYLEVHSQDYHDLINLLTKPFLTYINKISADKEKVKYTNIYIDLLAHHSTILKIFIKKLNSSHRPFFDGINDENAYKYINEAEMLLQDNNLDDEYMLWMKEKYDEDPDEYNSFPTLNNWIDKFWEFIYIKSLGLRGGRL